MNWNVISAVATVISMIAFVTSAVFVALEFRSLGKSRYLQISSELFSTWQGREFMEAQLWVIHTLRVSTWPEFIVAHRADYGEQAFHRVGSFYDRVGALVRLKLVEEREILTTIGPYAIAVWNKIEPLVREARRVENSTLFADFERLLPGCYECYVPNLKVGEAKTPFGTPEDVPRITVEELRRRRERNDAITLLDVRRTAAAGEESSRLPGAIVVSPDEVPQSLDALPPDREVVVYCS